MDLTYRIVRRLLRDVDVGFSRNRNFEAYEDARVQRALRIFRHVRSVEADLLTLGESASTVRLEGVDVQDEQVVLRLVFTRGEGHRISYLTAQEWRLLLENNRVSDILSTLLAQLEDDGRARFLGLLGEWHEEGVEDEQL